MPDQPYPLDRKGLAAAKRQYAAWCREQVTSGNVRGFRNNMAEECRLIADAEKAEAAARELENDATDQQKGN